MKLNIKRIVPLFVIILSLSYSISFAQKYLDVNSSEICECIKTVNDYLMVTYSDDIYRKTGIVAVGRYNSLIIISGAYLHVIELDQLFQDMYDLLKEQTIDYSKIRYIMLENYKYENGLVGDAIVISGEDFKSNINDFEAIKGSSIYLIDSYKSEKDPDIQKFLKSAMRGSVVARDWGPGKRTKAYSQYLEACEKAFVRQMKKSGKKK